MASDGNYDACHRGMAYAQVAYPLATMFGSSWGIDSPLVLAGAVTSYTLFQFPPSKRFMIERVYIRLDSNLTGTANASLVLQVKSAGVILMQQTLLAADWSGFEWNRTTKRSLIGGMVAVAVAKADPAYGRYDTFAAEEDGDNGGILNHGHFDSQTVTLDVSLGSHASMAGNVSVIMAGMVFE